MDRLCLKISKMMPFEMFRRESLVGSEQEQHFIYKYSQAFLKSKYHINLKKKVLRVLLTGSERTQQYSSVPGYTGSSTPVFSKHRQGGDRGWGGWSTSSSSSTSSTSPPYSSLIRSWWWYWQGRRTWLAFFVLSWRRFWMSVMCFWITKMTFLFKVVLGRQRTFLKNKKVFKRMLSLPDGGKKLNWERKVKFETLKVAATLLLRKNCTKT